MSVPSFRSGDWPGNPFPSDLNPSPSALASWLTSQLGTCLLTLNIALGLWPRAILRVKRQVPRCLACLEARASVDGFRSSGKGFPGPSLPSWRDGYILPQVSGHRLNLYYKNLQNLGKWISRPQPYDLSILSLGLRFTNLAPRERFVLPILPLGRDLCFQEYILWLYSLLDLNKP